MKQSPDGGALLRFAHTGPFTARSLVVHGNGSGKLYALRDGERQLIAEIHAAGGRPNTDFLPDAVETFSFRDVTAREFELVPAFDCRVDLGSAPIIAQVIEKQMGHMHPTPSPTWESYIFPDTVEPDDPASMVKMENIIDLTDQLGSDGTLDCTLPAGDWTVIHFGMVTTGRMNGPAPPEATGLEVDKMSRAHTRHHFNQSIRPLMERMSAQERAAFKGITIDSYEVGSQNWTDGFAAEFGKRNGYDPILLLPVLTGRVIDSAKVSDRFLWDLRRVNHRLHVAVAELRSDLDAGFERFVQRAAEFHVEGDLEVGHVCSFWTGCDSGIVSAPIVSAPSPMRHTAHPRKNPKTEGGRLVRQKGTHPAPVEELRIRLPDSNPTRILPGRCPRDPTVEQTSIGHQWTRP